MKTKINRTGQGMTPIGSTPGFLGLRTGNIISIGILLFVLYN